MIREYKSEDLEQVWDIYRDSLSDLRSRRQFENILDSSKTLVYEEDHEIRGQVIRGFIICIIDENEPWIWTLATSIGHRGKGIASALLKSLERYYFGETLNLFVGVNNPAQKLYFDLGYRAKKVKKEIYGDQDAIHMVKSLSSK